MQHLHQRIKLDEGDVLSVTLNSQANVMLMDDANYAQYKRQGRCKYFGGLANRSPVRLATPSSGYWNLVLDLGGRSGRIQYSVTIL